ncbi:MAG TPA: MBL fold metallo-hydrolase [Methanobacterium subterraneum]|uniref:MBL fold metallo-hydrolase n=1 Tax=Methanobacterium subterraneum TaxID=59277 RepID=A0A7J4TM45_9EURY|nr:MBL fold metallo-hydrolase [Methanobacterium subterraneum]
MRVTDDVYALDSTRGNYAYLITGQENVLVDTGRPGQGKGILNDLKAIGIKPEDIKHILITHHDVDHVGSLAFLEESTGAKIWASSEDIPYIYGKKSRPGIKRLVSVIMPIKKPEKIVPYPENGMIGDIKVIPTPGHTPGHVSLLFRDVLLVGDLCKTSHGKISPMSSLMNWDDGILKDSINKINDYDFKWVCPAHGEPLQVNKVLIID